MTNLGSKKRMRSFASLARPFLRYVPKDIPKSERNGVRIALRVPEALYRALLYDAGDNAMTLSSYIRQCLKEKSGM